MRFINPGFLRLVCLTALLFVPFGVSAAPTAPNPGEPAPAKKVSHVDAAGAAKLLADKKQVVVLDVRTPAEFEEGHIAGAKNIDFQAKDFADKLGALDKSQTYLVHCAAGGRSTRSLETFQKLGFTSIVHLDGGMNAWKKAGQPVTK